MFVELMHECRSFRNVSPVPSALSVFTQDSVSLASATSL